MLKSSKSEVMIKNIHLLDDNDIAEINKALFSVSKEAMCSVVSTLHLNDLLKHYFLFSSAKRKIERIKKSLDNSSMSVSTRTKVLANLESVIKTFILSYNFHKLNKESPKIIEQFNIPYKAEHEIKEMSLEGISLFLTQIIDYLDDLINSSDYMVDTQKSKKSREASLFDNYILDNTKLVMIIKDIKDKPDEDADNDLDGLATYFIKELINTEEEALFLNKILVSIKE